MRFSLAIISSLILLLGVAFPVHAQTATGCRPIFGGGPTCIQSGSLTIDKKLRNPQTNAFIDHADITDPKFAPSQTVVFQIAVQNTGSRALKDITVTDIFPQFVAMSKGTGKFDKTTNTLTYEIKNLEAKQTNTITVEGKVASANELAQTSGVLCVVNQVTVTQGRNTGTDNAQFCLDTVATPQTSVTTQNPQTPLLAQQPRVAKPPVLSAPNVAVTPKTGPEALALIGLLPAGVTGWFLRRKTQRE